MNKHFSSNLRSKKVTRNILTSFVFKGGNIVINLLLVSMTLNYLDQTKYGVWITITSIISWFSFFDIGLGNGLRNKLSEALALKDYELAKKYISSTYFLIFIIILLLIAVFFIINPFLNWHSILNASPEYEKEFSYLAQVIFVFFCLKLIINLITSVALSFQDPGFIYIFNFVGQALILLFIFVLTKKTEGSIVYLGLIYSIIPFCVLLILSIILFKYRYHKVRPGIRYINMKYAPELLNVGFSFFIIQVSSVLLFSINNIIITQLFGPNEVTPYNIAFKYFSIINMAFGIIIMPFWSAITEAYTLKDLDWIKRSRSKLHSVFVVFASAVVMMLIFSKSAYRLWIGDEIEIPFALSLVISVFTIVSIWNRIYSNFLNGIGIIRLQLIISSITAVINVPLAIYLGKLLGVPGVMLSTVIVVLASTVIFPIQFTKIINNSARGVWKK